MENSSCRERKAEKERKFSSGNKGSKEEEYDRYHKEII